MKLIFVLIAASLTSCVTRAVIHAKSVTVTVAPTVEIKATPLP